MAAKTLYSIRNWAEHFEVSQSKQIKGPLSWVAMPTKHDGLGYRRVIADPSMYAAWTLIVQVAAKCTTRGVLADENGPLDAEDLSLKTGAPASLFEQALKLLTSDKVGWITKSTLGARSECPTSTGQDRTVQDRTDSPNGESCSEPSATPDNSEQPVMTFPCVGMKGGTVWHLLPAKLSEYQESYPGIDALAEVRKALQWCRDNPTKRKTPKGMPAFLGRWLQSAQDRGRGPPVTGRQSRQPLTRPEGF